MRLLLIYMGAKMAHRTAHTVTALSLAAVALLLKDVQKGRPSMRPIGGSVLVALCTNIPDMLEPAHHPHHRQFFHSLVFAGIVGSGMKEVSGWNPKTESGEFVKFCLLCAGAGILVHLAMDLVTPRSLPLVGKL